MNRLAFFDTNIFVYADDTSSPTKQKLAFNLISEHQGSRLAVISLQVMQEYFAVATRKLKIAPATAQRKVELMARMNVVRFAESDVMAAIELHRLTRLSFWDAMIVHAARMAGAPVLYSEDLQHSSEVVGVSIVNPFLNN